MVSTENQLSGKIIAVTGYNSGIGKETALALAKLGATIVMVCRDQQRGEAAKLDIRRRSRNERVELMLCDLASLRSIRAFAEQFKRSYDRLDVLINNAGVVLLKRSMTEDGIESTFAINHIAHFLLTNLLLDVLKAGSSSRVVSVSSAVHRFANTDINGWVTGANYSAFGAYANSKLANVLFTYELARRLEGTTTTANCLHPGAVATNLFRGLPGFLQAIIKILTLGPERGARTSIFLASSPEVEGVSGKYFARRRPEKSSDASYDVEAARKLWEISAEMTGTGS